MIGAESHHSVGLWAPALQGQLVIRHIQMARSLPGLSGADVIFVPESNSGHSSQTYCIDIINARVPRVILMDEDEKHVGLRTDNASKMRMAVLMRNLLRAHMVKFHPMFFTTSEGYDGESMKKLIIQQFGDYKRKVKPRKRSGGADTGEHDYVEIFSGKFGNRRDDQGVCAQINAMGQVIFQQKYNERYRNKRPLFEEI